MMKACYNYLVVFAFVITLGARFDIAGAKSVKDENPYRVCEMFSKRYRATGYIEYQRAEMRCKRMVFEKMNQEGF